MIEQKLTKAKTEFTLKAIRKRKNGTSIKKTEISTKAMTQGKITITLLEKLNERNKNQY